MARSPRQRSAVTNGTRLHLEPVPGNSEAARRFRDLVEAAEVERGGAAAMTIAQREAVRAWAGLAVELARLHAKQAATPLTASECEAMGVLGDRMDRQSRRMGPVKAPRALTMEEDIARKRAARAPR